MAKLKKPISREFVSDVFLVVGGIATSVGVGLLHIAAGVITAGVLAMLFGYLITLGGEDA